MPKQLTSTPALERLGCVARCNGVVDYIDAHLGEPLDLHTLAAVAHFSPWHFHRLFHAMMGETLSERVRRRRLEAAAGLLLMAPPAPVQTVALDTGFGSSEVFARTFKAHFGVTPSAWRRGAHQAWTRERRLQLRKIHQEFREPDQTGARPSTEDDANRLAGNMKVELKTLPSLRVAYMRHVGPYGDPKIGRTWERFMRWADHHHLPDGKRLFIGVSHDSADIAMPGKCRYDACGEVDGNFRPQRDVGVQEVRGGLHGCTRFEGSSAEIYDAWLGLYREWLPDSGYQPDDRPCIEVYGNDVTVDAATGRFACTLCLPLRPL